MPLPSWSRETAGELQPSFLQGWVSTKRMSQEFVIGWDRNWLTHLTTPIPPNSWRFGEARFPPRYMIQLLKTSYLDSHSVCYLNNLTIIFLGVLEKEHRKRPANFSTVSGWLKCLVAEAAAGAFIPEGSRCVAPCRSGGKRVSRWWWA